jgi:putative ABC transport system permease protein
MSYALITLWHERQRYLPGVLAVAFSALLIALQCGLLLGLFSITSLPIDNNTAQLWMGATGVLSVDLGKPIPESYFARLASQRGVERTETYFQGFAYWSNPDGGTELCMITGSSLADNALGCIAQLTPEMRDKLSEPDAIIVDESDLDRLGIQGVGDTVEISGYQSKVVGLTKGVKGLAAAYVFCSRSTAARRLRLPPEQATYILGECETKGDGPEVVERVGNRYNTVSIFTKDDFSYRSRMHWLTKTKAGIALGCAAFLGLLVGAVVTYQTLSAATRASLREYAVLRALGIPRLRMVLMVLWQSFWVGVLGIGLAIPAVHAIAWATEAFNLVRIELPWVLQVGAAGITMVMAVLSGVLSLRALMGIDPAVLLR